jgi:alpha-L-fucosidase 2
MNYWLCGIANLSECFLPYIDYAKAYMASARALADDYIRTKYPEKFTSDGENGWFIGTAALPYYLGKADAHSGPGTGGFTSLLFWDYYDFTGDKEYLRTVGYPFLREMSLFLSKVLVEVDPKYFRPCEVEQLLGNPTKAKEKLGWNPRKTSFEELINIMVDNDIKKVKENPNCVR